MTVISRLLTSKSHLRKRKELALGLRPTNPRVTLFNEGNARGKRAASTTVASCVDQESTVKLCVQDIEAIEQDPLRGRRARQGPQRDRMSHQIRALEGIGEDKLRIHTLGDVTQNIMGFCINVNTFTWSK